MGANVVWVWLVGSGPFSTPPSQKRPNSPLALRSAHTGPSRRCLSGADLGSKGCQNASEGCAVKPDRPEPERGEMGQTMLAAPEHLWKGWNDGSRDGWLSSLRCLIKGSHSDDYWIRSHQVEPPLTPEAAWLAPTLAVKRQGRASLLQSFRWLDQGAGGECEVRLLSRRRGSSPPHHHHQVRVESVWAAGGMDTHMHSTTRTPPARLPTQGRPPVSGHPGAVVPKGTGSSSPRTPRHSEEPSPGRK